jgi:hypothetical protein
MNVMGAVDRRFTSAPAASAHRGDVCVVWPYLGHAAALDAASTTLLRNFCEPLTTGEVAEDLVASLGLGRAEAARVASDFVAALLASGHLLPEDATPGDFAMVSYPPAASP